MVMPEVGQYGTTTGSANCHGNEWLVQTRRLVMLSPTSGHCLFGTAPGEDPAHVTTLFVWEPAASFIPPLPYILHESNYPSFVVVSAGISKILCDT